MKQRLIRDPMTTRSKTIIICGGGLAGSLATLSLSLSLGSEYHIVQVGGINARHEDHLYGGATDPGSYNFLLRLGLDEPTLMLRSATSFSFGTHFRQWLGGRSWMQCHHAPLPTPSGIPLRHYLTRENAGLEPLLISAQAALAGKFAHPPADPRSVLASAEYGYQFDADEWVALLDRKIGETSARRINAEIRSIIHESATRSVVHLDTGEALEADLVVDASGLSRYPIEAAGGTFRTARSIGFSLSKTPSDALGPPCRTIDADETGWMATTHLQNARHTLRVSEAGMASDEAAAHTAALGHLVEAWVGNCVAIGHAASVFEPLTPAPMMMLQRDIERLLELIPAHADPGIERREFNRRFRDDVEHVAIFHGALMTTDSAPETEYWRAAREQTASGKLDRKLAQFSNRGLLTSFDLEPFNEEDWTIAHWGMGRRPHQHDRQVDGVSDTQSQSELGQIRNSVQQLVTKMPPHHLYVGKLKQYLEKQNYA